MMEIPDNLLCLFNSEVEQRGDSYIIRVPKSELSVGAIEENSIYRVAMFPSAATTLTGTKSERTDNQEQKRGRNGSDPPVSEGEERTVDIEDIGEQGDGIARVERGYVIVVPDTEKGERVVIRITDVKPNVGFAEVLSREDYYE